MLRYFSSVVKLPCRLEVFFLVSGAFPSSWYICSVARFCQSVKANYLVPVFVWAFDHVQKSAWHLIAIFLRQCTGVLIGSEMGCGNGVSSASSGMRVTNSICVCVFVLSVLFRCSPPLLQTTRELVALACDIRPSPEENEFLGRLLQLARQEGLRFDPGVS